MVQINFKLFKDPVSGLTHFIGVILALIGLLLLVTNGAVAGRPWRLTAFIIFGVSMILLYTASTLYHWLPLSAKGTELLRKLDHSMIFLLIAGTYTPICLIGLRGVWGWSLFGCIWGLALIGIGFKSLWFNAPRWLSTVIYAVMGWLVVIAIPSLARSVPQAGLAWLIAGGLFYTVGAVIYGLQKPNPCPKVFGFHEIFHILVILGSISHFWMVYHYLAAVR